MEIATKYSCCRVCQDTALEKVWSLGMQPLANAFLRKEELESEELFLPLDVYFCHSCFLLQLCDVVPPEILFRDYVYASSTSQSFVAHFESFANSVIQQFQLKPDSLVIDIGSNDGILLRPFKSLGIQVLGVEPAKNIANIAIQNGVDTITDFFNPDLAQKVVRERGGADIITATNVFAHVNNLQEFVEASKVLLKDDGVLIIEVPYLVDLIEKRLWDTVYHEHLSYFSVQPLTMLFNRNDMRIIEVQRKATHGGSLRVFITKRTTDTEVDESVGELLKGEETLGLHSKTTFTHFSDSIRANKLQLVQLLKQIKSQGKRIAGYGAPAKGNTLLNYCGIGLETLDFIVDDSVLKQGLYTPGTHIPVVSLRRLYEDRPDYVLILAWNFAASIINNLSDFRKGGGRFIIPVPQAHIVS